MADDQILPLPAALLNLPRQGKFMRMREQRKAPDIAEILGD
jgi:hypothetical protein